jgi:uncharacterized membrane protein YobD (UPF0266 family)
MQSKFFHPPQFFYNGIFYYWFFEILAIIFSDFFSTWTNIVLNTGWSHTVYRYQITSCICSEAGSEWDKRLFMALGILLSCRVLRSSNAHLTWLLQKKTVGDGEKLLTYLNSVLNVLLGTDIFLRVPKKVKFCCPVKYVNIHFFYSFSHLIWLSQKNPWVMEQNCLHIWIQR